MYPTNQYMDPYYSHYRNHAPFSYYPPPGWEAGHTGAMDPSYRPPSYGPWPYIAGMHHPHPPEFHCCCGNSYPAAYYGFRHPFPPELPPPHLYHHGPFPQLPSEYPAYFVRPHPYPVEQTPYDYNKFKSHCCGCPNHVWHGGEKSNVKIEEEKPERELKGGDISSTIRHPNNQYPVIWFPSGNAEDKENGKRYESPPQLLNGWVPLSSKMTDDAKQQGQNDQKGKQYQWPIVWMPAGYDEPKEKARELREEGGNPKITDETPPSPKIKIVPLSWFEDQKPAGKSGSRDHSDTSAVESQPATTEHRDGTAVEGHHKTTPVVSRGVNDERKPKRENYKTIPVLHAKEMDKNKPNTCRTIPVMAQKENDEKNAVLIENKEEKNVSSARKQGENGQGNQTESTTAKHSKLPPVCLRVDPLPRKKPGNGSSRSPSPPRKDADKAKKDMNEAQSQNLEPKQSDTKKHMILSEVKEKSSDEMKKGMGFETVPAASAKHSEGEEVHLSKDNQKVQDSRTSAHTQENAGVNIEGAGTQETAGAETLKECDRSTNLDERIQIAALKDDSKTFRANLTEADAAVHIQSAYRGYVVRRWQPLDKLRKIRDVHEQMQTIRKQLQGLEASSNKPTEKEQLAISEAIMNLLLKLDTIQGLHPCVREARKSVARELICLQEKLDSLCKQPTGGFNNTTEDERLDKCDSAIHNAAPTLTAEASDKEEKAVGPSETKETSSVNFMELGDAVPSEINTEVRQDGDSREMKNQDEKSCTSTMEVPHEEGKAAEQVEFQGASSTDMISSVTLPEHSHDNHECQIEASHVGSLEANEEEKKITVVVEGQEMPPVDSMGPSHDAATAVDSTRHDKYMASTVQSFHAEEPNTGVSPAVTEDIKATTVTESLDNGLTADNDGLAEDKTREAVDMESPEQKHDVPPAEKNPDVILDDSLVSLKDAESHKHDPTTAAESIMTNVDEEPGETRNLTMQEQVADSMLDSTKEPNGGTSEASMGLTADNDGLAEDQTGEAVDVERPELKHDVPPPEETPDVILDDSLVYLKDAEPHKHDQTTAANSVMSNVAGEPEEARNMNMLEQVADSMLDSTKEPDGGTLEASMGPTVEEPDQAALVEPTSELDSVSEQTVLEESNNAMQSDLSGKDGAPQVDQKNEVIELTGGDLDVQESNDIVAGRADPKVETVFQEFDSSESSAGYERPEMEVSLKSQPAVQNEGVHSSCPDVQTRNTDERTEMLKDAPAGVMGANSVEEVGACVSTEECNGTPDDSTICATVATPAEVEGVKPKEDVNVQTESRASAEALTDPVTPDGMKEGDEKNLAEENQKLRALLQNLLASGSDQMEVITDLSEKVKELERKLARKKKPKVRVRRPARHATAKAH